MKYIFTLFILTCSSLFIKAQDLYLVKLKAKENTSNYILSYLSLLFVPIGVGVVMHLSYLENNLFKV